LKKILKKGLDTSEGVRYKGSLVGLVVLETVYFQYVPHLFMFLPGLHNLGTIPREAEKSEGSRLSTPVEKPVDNSKTALEADRTHREPY
jgi:hypothetical protein